MTMEAWGFVGMLGQGGERNKLSSVSTTAGTKWKPRSNKTGGKGMSEAARRPSSMARRPQYRILMTISMGAATRAR